VQADTRLALEGLRRDDGLRVVAGVDADETPASDGILTASGGGEGRDDEQQGTP
jgi:hypothetical protein